LTALGSSRLIEATEFSDRGVPSVRPNPANRLPDFGRGLEPFAGDCSEDALNHHQMPHPEDRQPKLHPRRPVIVKSLDTTISGSAIGVSFARVQGLSTGLDRDWPNPRVLPECVNPRG
jgi:hypothetical protein